MSSQLTIKQRKFVKTYVKNEGNGTQAVLESYKIDNPNTAGAIASENLRKPKIKEALEKALVKLDITPERVLKTFLNVTEVHMEQNPNAAVRANENLAQIMNLYPSQKSLTMDDGNVKSVSWQE